MRREYWWALLTLVIAIALAFILLSTAKDDSRSDPIPPELHSVYDQKLNRLDRRGVEAAYTNRVALLFQNWMTDTTAASGDRARKGYANARKIYIEVMSGIDARDPPSDDDLK